jgi:NTP pyrophosphatase (non-canonical NTP hydrolase)
VNGNEAYNELHTLGIINLVYEEGVKARRKHGDAPLATDAELITVLVEEVGEVAKAYNQLKPDEFRKELVQVASVAIRHLAGDLTFSSKP